MGADPAPAAPVAALKAHDYPGFAAQQLAERQQAGFPPFTHLALLRAEARSQDAAQACWARWRRRPQAAGAADAALAAALLHVSWYPAVPLAVQRVAGVERAQMLLEEAPTARRCSACWPLARPAAGLRATPEHRAIVRWAIDVDPQEL